QRRQGPGPQAGRAGGSSLAGEQDQHRGPFDPRAGRVVRQLPRHPGPREVRRSLPVGAPAPRYLIPHSRPHVCEDDVQAVARVVRGGQLAQGPEVQAFERELAERVGVAAAAAVASGTAALELALRALDVGPGAEVIVPSYACDALYHAVTRCGASATPAEADPSTLTLSVSDALRPVRPRPPPVIVPPPSALP